MTKRWQDVDSVPTEWRAVKSFTICYGNIWVWALIFVVSYNLQRNVSAGMNGTRKEGQRHLFIAEAIKAGLGFSCPLKRNCQSSLWDIIAALKRAFSRREQTERRQGDCQNAKRYSIDGVWQRTNVCSKMQVRGGNTNRITTAIVEAIGMLLEVLWVLSVRQRHWWCDGSKACRSGK